MLKKNKWHERIRSRTHPAHKERGGLSLHRTRRVLISLWACVIRSTWRGFMEKRTSWCWSPNISFFWREESTSKIKKGQWINIKRNLQNLVTGYQYGGGSRTEAGHICKGMGKFHWISWETSSRTAQCPSWGSEEGPSSVCSYNCIWNAAEQANLLRLKVESWLPGTGREGNREMREC